MIVVYSQRIYFFDIKPTELTYNSNVRFSYKYQELNKYMMVLKVFKINKIYYIKTNQLKNKKEMIMRTKIGIVGSRVYTNKKKVKDLIF